MKDELMFQKEEVLKDLSRFAREDVADYPKYKLMMAIYQSLRLRNMADVYAAEFSSMVALGVNVHITDKSFEDEEFITQAVDCITSTIFSVYQQVFEDFIGMESRTTVMRNLLQHISLPLL